MTSHSRSFGRQTRRSSPPARSNAPEAPATARSVVCERLTHEVGRFPDLGIDELDVRSLDDRDAALARAIFGITVRRWITLRRLIDPSLSRPWSTLDAPVRAALLSGAAQLLFLDRVPPHAAIDETVDWVKGAARPAAAGLVNAVLRRVSELRQRDDAGNAERCETWSGAGNELPLADGSALLLTRNALPEPEHERLEAAFSMPRWALRRWAGAFGDDEATRIALHALAEPPVLINIEHARDTAPESTTPHRSPQHAVFAGPRGSLGAWLDQHPRAWVQDPTSSAAISTVADLQPKLVIDACAGVGTKTRQLLTTFPEADVVAADIHNGRLETLSRTLGHDPRLAVRHARDVLAEFAGRADLLLLDVPCSNSGVLARRPEAKYRLGPPQLERLAGQQRQIIADTLPLLSPGGRVLYSTCSIDFGENDAVEKWACKWHRFRPSRRKQHLPQGGASPDTYRDGGFSVLLER